MRKNWKGTIRDYHIQGDDTMEKMGIDLYRIVSLESFLSLLINKTERFVRPMDGWEDTFEGDILHLLDDEEGEKRIINILYNDLVKHRTFDAIRNYVRLLHARYLCYGQCWSTLKDSDAMWRIYSYGNRSIQLITTAEKINDMIINGSDWSGRKPNIEKVKYDSRDTPLIQNLPEYFSLGMFVDEPFFHKRIAFSHENEVRVVLNDVDKYRNYVSAWSGMLEANYSFENKNAKDLDSTFEEKLISAAKRLKDNDGTIPYLKHAPKELFLKIKDLSTYIVGVRVHPQAEIWYVELIQKICKQYNINFIGQSDLYNKAM